MSTSPEKSSSSTFENTKSPSDDVPQIKLHQIPVDTINNENEMQKGTDTKVFNNDKEGVNEKEKLSGQINTCIIESRINSVVQ